LDSVLPMGRPIPDPHFDERIEEARVAAGEARLISERFREIENKNYIEMDRLEKEKAIAEESVRGEKAD